MCCHRWERGGRGEIPPLPGRPNNCDPSRNHSPSRPKIGCRPHAHLCVLLSYKLDKYWTPPPFLFLAFVQDSPEHVASALRSDREDKLKRLEMSLASDLASRRASQARRRNRRRTASGTIQESKEEKVMTDLVFVSSLKLFGHWRGNGYHCRPDCQWRTVLLFKLTVIVTWKKMFAYTAPPPPPPPPP